MRIIRRNGFQVASYVEESLFVAETFDDCARAQMFFIQLLPFLGFRFKWGKVSGPCNRIVFLGLVLDSLTQRIELPADKPESLKKLSFD